MWPCSHRTRRIDPAAGPGMPAPDSGGTGGSSRHSWRRLPGSLRPGNGSAWALGDCAQHPDLRGQRRAEEIWFLAQTPWVLLHGHNPFVNNWLNTPVGVEPDGQHHHAAVGHRSGSDHSALRPDRDVQHPDRRFDLCVAMSFFVMAGASSHGGPPPSSVASSTGSRRSRRQPDNAHLFLLFQAVPPLVIYFVHRFLRSSRRLSLGGPASPSVPVSSPVLHRDRGHSPPWLS